MKGRRTRPWQRSLTWLQTWNTKHRTVVTFTKICAVFCPGFTPAQPSTTFPKKTDSHFGQTRSQRPPQVIISCSSPARNSCSSQTTKQAYVEKILHTDYTRIVCSCYFYETSATFACQSMIFLANLKANSRTPSLDRIIMDMEVKRSELETHGLRIARAALALSRVASTQQSGA
jgi:hypothetical protein